MKQRILLAQALLNDPEILILDEPTAGMDPEERIRIRNFISGCAKDKIVLLATHVVADVENMAREILLIKNGKIVRRDTPQKFLAELEHKVYNVLVTEREGEEYQNSGARIISVTLTEKGHRLRIISADALKTGNVEEVYPCLEDVYLYWIDRE
jgi:ABC-type multidrug transport system ATPase subunit